MAYEQEFDLGLATAYAYAVSKGYTGTEEEFATLMASYATVAEAAAASASAAADSATAASGSAGTASTKASEAAASASAASGSASTASTKAGEAASSASAAAGSASTASTKAGEAASSASAAAGSASTASTKAGEASASATNANTAKVAAQAAQTAAETAQGKAEDAQEAAEAAAEQAEATLSSYAKVDGSYNSMTVGNAEQLVATVAVEDSVPYNFRTSGGTADIGDREVDKIVGGTVAWNNVGGENIANWVTASVNTSYADGELTVMSTSDNTTIKAAQSTFATDHVYYVRGDYKSDGTSEVAFGAWTATNGAFTPAKNPEWSATATYTSYATVLKAQQNSYCGCRLRNAVARGGYGVFKNIVCIDLTQMFGTTIADYIYSLETATPGAGVAWFRKLFPKPYYAYNPGELMSVQAAAHKMVGFNAWDGQAESGTFDQTTGEKTSNAGLTRTVNPIRVLPNTTYCLTKTGTSLAIRRFYYDAGMNFIASEVWAYDHSTFVTPSDCHYLNLAYQNSITNVCLNLSWDGERDGEYAPYEAHTYPLDDSLTLRGIPKLDSGNALYYDGDVYESDGTVTRRYGVVDLGTLAWAKMDDERLDVGYYFQSSVLTNVKPGYAHINAKYTEYVGIGLTAIINALGASVNRVLWNTFSNGNVFAIDSAYTDAADFKAAMSGVMLVYELATPTTEAADPFQSPQIVDDFGTEEYVDAAVAAQTRDVAIPVGHDTLYQANLRAKLEMSPDSPDGDGDYIVRQTNGTNAYVPLTKELPAAPTTEGTYHLKATVTSGGVTLTWEADT